MVNLEYYKLEFKELEQIKELDNGCRKSNEAITRDLLFFIADRLIRIEQSLDHVSMVIEEEG